MLLFVRRLGKGKTIGTETEESVHRCGETGGEDNEGEKSGGILTLVGP